MQPSKLLLDFDYLIRNNLSIPRVWWIEDGKARFEELELRPYLLLNRPEDVHKLTDSSILKIEQIEKLFGTVKKTLSKVTVKSTGDVVRLRDQLRAIGFEVYEADIPFHSRCLIDLDFPDEVFPNSIEQLKVMSLDIEVLDAEKFPKADKDAITMVSLAWREDDKVKSHIVGLEEGFDEKKILQKLVTIIKQINPDCIVGYNSNRFDWPYIIKRAEINEVVLDIGRDGTALRKHEKFEEPICAGRHLIDLMYIIKRDLYDQIKVATLKNACDILGIRKSTDRVIIEGKELHNTWKTNPDLVIQYTIDDGVDTLALGEALLQKMLPLSKLARARLTEMAHAKRGRQVEHFMMLECVRQSRIIPRIAHAKAEKFVGAHVFEPKYGIYRTPIRVIDVASMYPTIVINHNLSPETLCRIEDCAADHHTVPELGHKFHKDSEGFVPHLEKKLKALREPLKAALKKLTEGTREFALVEAEQWALKLMANSIYGLFGWTESRWYVREIAESTTGYGRYYIQETAKIASNEFDIKILYGDTDSIIMFEHPNVQKLIDAANTRFPVVFDDEGLYIAGLFPKSNKGDAAKKRYALLKADGTMKIRGLELRRGDWCALAKNVQQQCLDMVLRNNDVDGAVKFVRKTLEDLSTNKVTKDLLVVYKKIGELDNYKQPPAHVRAAVRDLKEEDLAELVDTKVGYVVTYVKGAKSLNERIKLIDTIQGDWRVDTEYYKNKQVLPAALKILEILEYKGTPISEETLISENRQINLSSWF